VFGDGRGPGVLICEEKKTAMLKPPRPSDLTSPPARRWRSAVCRPFESPTETTPDHQGGALSDRASFPPRRTFSLGIYEHDTDRGTPLPLQGRRSPLHVLMDGQSTRTPSGIREPIPGNGADRRALLSIPKKVARSRRSTRPGETRIARGRPDGRRIGQPRARGLRHPRR